MSDPTPEAKRAAEKISFDVYDGNSQKCAASFAIIIQSAIDQATADKDKVIEGLKGEIADADSETLGAGVTGTENAAETIMFLAEQRNRLQAQLEEAQQATADLHKEFISVVKERDEARGEIDEWTQATTRERSQRINYGTRIDMLTEELTQAEKARDELVGLVGEMRKLLDKAFDNLTEFGGISDESRVGWWLQEYDKFLRDQSTLLARIDAKGEK